MIRPRRRSGSLMLGMAGFTFVVAAAVAIVMVRSTDAYASAVRQERALAMRFGAEGALCAIHANQLAAGEKLAIGDCQVELVTAEGEGTRFRLSLVRKGRLIQTGVYNAIQRADGTWTLTTGNHR